MGSNGRRGGLALLGCVGALVCALSVTGCSNDDGSDDDKNQGAASANDAGGAVSTYRGPDASALLSDGQIYELLMLMNTGEEAVAEMAEQRTDHSELLSVALQIDDAQALIDTVLLPESGAPNLQILVQETRDLVATHLAELQSLEGDAGVAS